MGKQADYDELMTTLAAYVTHGTQAAAAESLGVGLYTVWNRLSVLEGRVGQVLERSETRPICRTPVLNETGRRLLKKFKENES